MPVTLSDIARELGVSKMTISRAINNHPNVNSETRARVLDFVRKVNYRPNPYARALTTNRAFLIGIVVPDFMHSYFAEISKGVEDVARPARYQNLICTTYEDSQKEIHEVEALLTRTDGLIIASALTAKEAKFYLNIIKDGAKVVLIDRRLDGVPSPVVKTDDVQVGMLATEHLIRLGHRKIGLLQGPLVSTAIDRSQGYKEALVKHGLELDKSLVRDCGYTEREGYEAMKGWIHEGTFPPAVFACNDPAAIGAMTAIEDAGLKVPDDVAIVGAGNIHYGDRLRVPLTTIAWSTIEMGQAAARLLIRGIEDAGGSMAAQVVLKPELIVRYSCGEKMMGARLKRAK